MDLIVRAAILAGGFDADDLGYSEPGPSVAEIVDDFHVAVLGCLLAAVLIDALGWWPKRWSHSMVIGVSLCLVVPIFAATSWAVGGTTVDLVMGIGLGGLVGLAIVGVLRWQASRLGDGD